VDLGVSSSITGTRFPYYILLSIIWWACSNSTLMGTTQYCGYVGLICKDTWLFCGDVGVTVLVLVQPNKSPMRGLPSHELLSCVQKGLFLRNKYMYTYTCERNTKSRTPVMCTQGTLHEWLNICIYIHVKGIPSHELLLCVHKGLLWINEYMYICRAPLQIYRALLWRCRVFLTHALISAVRVSLSKNSVTHARLRRYRAFFTDTQGSLADT